MEVAWWEGRVSFGKTENVARVVWCGAVRCGGRFVSFRFEGLTPSEPQSRFGDKPVKFKVICPRNGTAVLKGSIFAASAGMHAWHVSQGILYIRRHV